MSFLNFKEATQLNPKLELASLGVYVTSVDLGRDEEAILELTRFLRSYRAKFYKYTLEELLEGLANGYMTKYEDNIKYLAGINGITFPDS